MPRDARVDRIVDFWNQVSFLDDSGETTWEVIGQLERIVADSLAAYPPNIARASAVTARAGRLLENAQFRQPA